MKGDIEYATFSSAGEIKYARAERERKTLATGSPIRGYRFGTPLLCKRTRALNIAFMHFDLRKFCTLDCLIESACLKTGFFTPHSEER